jgi:hypothetical protein
MADIHRQLLLAARNHLKLSTEHFALHRYRRAAEEASMAVGFLSFLLEHPETSEDILKDVNKIFRVAENRILNAHERWVRDKLNPRLSGRSLEEESEFNELIQDSREASRAAIEEVGS